MRSKLATFALAGAVGLTGVAGAALVAPALSYAATGDSTALSNRVAAIEQALTGLVSDGTLTQAQADKVASTLAERGPVDGPHGPGRPGGPGGFGGPGGPGGLAGALEDLGITREELRAAAQAGTTLGDLAKANGVSSAKLVDALVAAGKARLDDAVADGRLTQAQADERAADAKARITDSLDEPVRLGHGHHGWRSHDDGDADDDGTAPSQTPSTAPSAGNDA